jgi:DNA-binding CsgD family transcriptional regulator
MVTESIYVIDVAANRFCYVSPNDLFLCGHSVEDAKKLGFDFYQKILHPNDLSLWKNMYKTVLLYLEDPKKNQDEVSYCTCTFRLERKYSFLIHPLSQMVFHRMKPVWTNDKLHYLICSVGSSTAKNTGNLRMYNEDGLSYDEYDFTAKRWEQKTIKPLTERENAILMLAKQGKIVKEIANDFDREYKTIDKQITNMYNKLGVCSMLEACIISNSFCMKPALSKE